MHKKSKRHIFDKRTHVFFNSYTLPLNLFGFLITASYRELQSLSSVVIWIPINLMLVSVKSQGSLSVRLGSQ